MAAVIFGPDYVRALKPGIKLGQNATIYSGTADPTVTPTNDESGDIYISTTEKKLYQKQDSGVTTDWDVLGSTTPVSKYKLEFNATTDWTLNVDVYEITILGTTHQKGNDPFVQLFEINAGISTEVTSVIKTDNSNGDTVIEVSSAPDNRFAGKILIS